MEDSVTYTPVPCLCSGVVTGSSEDGDTLGVSIYNSPDGEFNGPIPCKEIIQPGLDGNLKKGDFVKVMVTFNFGGVEQKFKGLFPGGSNFILGTFNEERVSDVQVENPISSNDNDRVRFTNRSSGSGLVATDSGKLALSTGGSVYSFGSPFGYGINENFWKINAQNHHRVIGENDPEYLAREHFGLFNGNKDDRLGRVTDEDFQIVFRRFVTQTRSPDNWVATCEGTFSPWVGANNNSQEVKAARETLLSKVVNHGDSRLTIEAGEPGVGFVTIRVDDVIESEEPLSDGNGATPGEFGNRFKMEISDDGALDVRAGGSGESGENTNKFHMSVDTDGNLTIHAANKIEISHGDDDGDVNSIKMDPGKGVDITATNGFRVNGIPVVNQNFLDWMNKWKTQFCLVTAIGSPAPIHPGFSLPDFISGQLPGKFKTDPNGAAASGEIKDDDEFNSN